MNNQPKSTKRHLFLKIITIIVTGCYLASLAGWYISPLWLWPVGLASLAFIYLWLLLIILFGAWLSRVRRFSVYMLVLAFAGYQPLLATVSVGWSSGYKVEKPANLIRVMQWNCMDLPGVVKGWHMDKRERKAAAEFILLYTPDIICLQDFNETIGEELESNIALLADSLGYRFHLFEPYASTDQPYGKVLQGSAIFSKIPPLRQGVLLYKGKLYSESILWADYPLDGKLVRIVTTHFSSMQLFSYKLYTDKPMPYYLLPDSAIIMSQNIPQKIKFFQHEHVLQALQLRNFMDTCSVPVILAADLNTIPASFVYQRVRGNMDDGFLGSKTGLGNTYNFLAPHLRIDYLLSDKRLDISQWKHFTDGFFDHDHLMADYGWKPTKKK